MSQDTITLEVQSRDVLGKAVKHLRKDGIIPAVVHDHGKPSIVVMGDEVQMLKAYKKAGMHHPIELTADGKKYVTLIKTATFEPKKNRLTHIVFNAVNRNEKVEAEIPLRPHYDEGNDASPAERASLMVLQHVTTVLVEATATNLPDFLEYDAEKLVAVGDSVTVADVIAPAHVVIKAEPDTSVASVFEPSAIAAANDAAGGDADAGDESTVDSEHESNAEQNTQSDEIRPGGKKEFEDKEQGHDPEKK
ncbi:MAG: rplY [Candidatus Saccharibacteria bacterium]|nr:rplY [Candidatus Saccharibacteria bacterium]